MEDSVLRISRFGQTISTVQDKEAANSITTHVTWECVGGSLKAPLLGRLEVEGSYIMNSKGDLELSLSECVLDPATGSAMPPDPVALCAMLERATPGELFHLEGAVVKTVFLDPELRIAEVSGPGFPAATAIFKRPPGD